jgi:hypothetical protein
MRQLNSDIKKERKALNDSVKGLVHQVQSNKDKL